MKYIVILGDGMADWHLDELHGKTPLQAARKPHIDDLAKNSIVGLCKTVPDGYKPGSDVANLSVMGYDPHVCYTGRSPLEAVSIGIDLKSTDVTLRCNLVTLSDEKDYESRTMVDYSAGEITTEESHELIKALKDAFDGDRFTLYAGISYRHCLVAHDGKTGHDLTPPHDITGKKIRNYLPKGEYGALYLEMMKKSAEILNRHPINVARKARGLNTANSVWFWGEGTKPSLENFHDKFGISGSVISAVDLVKGIGILSGLNVIEVKGATGTYETNFRGKASAAVDSLLNGNDFVYIHMEAPDECGHQGDLVHKIYSIEQIDEQIVSYVCQKLREAGEDFRILICPDHPTPIAVRTHVSDPIPFLIYDSRKPTGTGAISYDEDTAKDSGVFIEHGYDLMRLLLERCSL